MCVKKDYFYSYVIIYRLSNSLSNIVSLGKKSGVHCIGYVENLFGKEKILFFFYYQKRKEKGHFSISWAIYNLFWKEKQDLGISAYYCCL